MDLGIDGTRVTSLKIILDEEEIVINVDNRAAIRQAIFNLVKEKTGKDMLPHSSWGIQSKKDMENDWDYNSIAVHHEGNSGSCDASLVSASENAQNKHFKRKFDDIGYHYIISCTGEIAEGRDIRKKGAHVRDNNTGIIGILLQGDYSVRGEAGFFNDFPNPSNMKDLLDFSNSEEVSELQYQALEILINCISEFFLIEKLGGHREFALSGDYRVCPGNIAMRKVEALRKKLSLKEP